ncbi:hypothetical protein CDAR_4411 [Caerostris darwini]|uniref:Uncharacterized protein n=1 Tax=Caerostris darwini TaxID=1538125 RepID=A0AAV4VAR1_9ARAC|nr:hypothetical protein CDAR_4411 [Caerostris darwini]
MDYSSQLSGQRGRINQGVSSSTSTKVPAEDDSKIFRVRRGKGVIIAYTNNVGVKVAGSWLMTSVVLVTSFNSSFELLSSPLENSFLFRDQD